eukprot:scaffold12934_cov20-Tisochrysis_lutea.AAC.5
MAFTFCMHAQEKGVSRAIAIRSLAVACSSAHCRRHGIQNSMRVEHVMSAGAACCEGAARCAACHKGAVCCEGAANHEG